MSTDRKILTLKDYEANVLSEQTEASEEPARAQPLVGARREALAFIVSVAFRMRLALLQLITIYL